MVHSYNSTPWPEQAEQQFLQREYSQAAALYEKAIEAEPEVKSYYWYLGLALLLQGQEPEAQMAWLAGMAGGEPEQVDHWTIELIQILQAEAERREAQSGYEVAWVIRQYIREIAPNFINNLLYLLLLGLQLEQLTSEDLEDFAIIDLLQSAEKQDTSSELLLTVLEAVLTHIPIDSIIIKFAEACAACTQDLSSLMRILVNSSIQIAHRTRQFEAAAALLEIYLHSDPNNVEVLGHLSSYQQNAGNYDAGIATARLRYELTTDLPQKVFSSHLLLRALMSTGGRWQEAQIALEQHEKLLLDLIEAKPTDLATGHSTRLYTASYFLPYFQDDLKKNRWFQNEIVAICQANAQNQFQDQTVRYQQARTSRSTQAKTRPLKIGYLSHCMCQHSVGWLARWLLQYHNRDRFQIYGYFINYKEGEPLQEWYASQVNRVCKIGVDCPDTIPAIAEKIHQDEIDVLIDLDSITLDITCDVLALKPAPVQVTWLGWDASGVPAVDYFIADPYVLPEWAQQHYSEKIWRLPETYIAVDGFEVGIPTLRREQLNIPEDALIYFSSQKGYKRHAATVHLQMKILAQVPNSYFLIKGFADQDLVQAFFENIAEQEGVAPNRLRFLPDAPTEAVHRADLAIADVVLDTYPYNGATTTLETLWMGVPLVTRVGEQFAARNSYSMMMNVGVTEGIAWSDDEYIDWGVRFGQDVNLRKDVTWQLLKSRQTAPLWNAKQFTAQMEYTYEQMWNQYMKNTLT